MKRALLLILLAAPTLSSAAGVISGSLEQFNNQIGSSTLKLKRYDAFDQMSGAPDFLGVTSLSVQVNDGPVENIPYSSEYEALKRRQSWGSVAEMVAARPVDATLTYTLAGSPSGTVTINAPGINYEDAVPNSPMFDLGGVYGIWTLDVQGRNIFNIDGGSIGNSFTVALNPHSASTAGDYRFSSVQVDATAGGSSSWVDTQFNIVDGVGATLPPLSLTFTRGLPLNGGDTDVSTYGFGVGVLFALQGEFGNIFGLEDAGLGDDSRKAFIYQNNTSLYLRVVPAGVLPPQVPLPAAWLLMSSGMLALFSLCRRCRRLCIKSGDGLVRPGNAPKPISHMEQKRLVSCR